MKNTKPRIHKDAFDSELYIKEQVAMIKDKSKSTLSQKVYVEFGGKIFDDMHASRVLPGYYPDMKLRIIKKLFKQSDLIFVVSAKDILRKRIRGDHKITYDKEVLRLLVGFEKESVIIKNIVITMMPSDGSLPSDIHTFVISLRKENKIVKFLKEDSDHVNEKKDWTPYQQNDFFKTAHRYVIILSPGGGSGKFGVCVNQLYHEMNNGVSPFYIKFETFPVHNFSVLHPINLAYMAASADFYDLVMKDPRKKDASSYNRDVENYELLHRIARHFKKEGIFLRKITSATNMGVNVVSRAIIDSEKVEKEAAAEIGRRLIRHKYEIKNKQEKQEILDRIKKIISLL